MNDTEKAKRLAELERDYLRLQDEAGRRATQHFVLLLLTLFGFAFSMAAQWTVGARVCAMGALYGLCGWVFFMYMIGKTSERAAEMRARAAALRTDAGQENRTSNPGEK